MGPIRISWIVLVNLSISLVISNAFVVPRAEQEGKKIYKNYKLLRTQPILDEIVAKSLMNLETLPEVSFWVYPHLNGTADIFTAPEQFDSVQSIMDALKLQHEVVVDDMEDLIEQESASDELLDDNSLSPKAVTRMNWAQFHRYDTIMEYARNQGLRDARVSTTSIGRSSEGRDILLVKISSDNRNNKPAIWIDGGMHAREWISPATVTYIMDQLLTSPQGKSLVDKFDWYIVPLINVDGYEYAHEKQRMWRKTRSNNAAKPYCKGVDPNRNWGFKWATTGSSNDPCAETYHGPRPFSEPETTAVSNAILARKNQIKLYLTFHSYSQMWLVPWGYAKHPKPADYNDLIALARHGKTALERTSGTQYRLGTAPDLLYEAAGGSDDWAKGVAGIKYSYCIELRDTGRYGFILPANQILPTGKETFNGVAALADALHKTL